jgi:hypothetical protein
MNRWIYQLTGLLMAFLLAGTPDLYAAALGQPSAEVSSSTVASTSYNSEVRADSQAAEAADGSLPDSPSTSQSKRTNQNDFQDRLIELAQAQGSTPTPRTQQQVQPQNPPAQSDLQAQPGAQAQPNSSEPQPPNSQPQGAQQQNASPQQPVGAAAAQIGRTEGGAAAKPAGAALAPAEQHRSHSLLIRVGLVGAAAVALGTAYGLAKASPSRPPGAH